MDDLTMRDQRMIFSVITLVHIADSLEQLDADSEAIISIGREHLCDLSVAHYQQEDGLNTVLPYGLRRIKALHTLTTESCAVAVPFRTQEIQEPGGIYYGTNLISNNPIVCDRKRLVSPHAFYLGVSGSGKSMGMKSTIENVALGTEDDIMILDAEREYGALARAFGGEVIEISPNSIHHINPLEVAKGYEDENLIALKSELITSILEQQMGAGVMKGSYKSIIDRCTAKVFRAYLGSDGISGLEGKRSGLFYEAIRIIREMRDATDGSIPTIAVWENVMGAFSSNDRMDFKAVLGAFTDWTSEWGPWRPTGTRPDSSPALENQMSLFPPCRQAE